MRRIRPVEHPHDTHSELRLLAHERQERALVDDGELGRLARQGGGAARTIVDQGHLAENAVGSHTLQHRAEGDDVDPAGVHHVETVAGVVLEKDAFARIAAAELHAAADQCSKVEWLFCHAHRLRTRLKF